MEEFLADAGENFIQTFNRAKKYMMSEGKSRVNINFNDIIVAVYSESLLVDSCMIYDLKHKLRYELNK